MDIFTNLAIGFSVAITLKSIVYCFIGVFLGTLIGVLPGIGPVATVAMLLPLTFNLDPATSMIMLAGIYYGAQYGGSTTAILVNIPGESSSVVTTLDGYQMARQGRAGPALGIAAIGSFVAGTVATLIVALFSPPLAAIALKFQPADYFSLMVFGLIGAVVLARGSLRKAIAMVILGLVLAQVGTDVNSGVPRFTFGIPSLTEGISFVALAMGMFGVAEVIYNLEQRGQDRRLFTAGLTGVLPSRADLNQSKWSIARGTALGSILGILPGGGALLASFAAYTIEKKVAKPRAELRSWRYSRSRCTGICQQRRCANLIHSDAHPRSSFKSDNGPNGWRLDDSRYPAWAGSNDPTPGALLGHYRFNVDWQPISIDS